MWGKIAVVILLGVVVGVLMGLREVVPSVVGRAVLAGLGGSCVGIAALFLRRSNKPG